MAGISSINRRLIFLPGAGGDPGFWRPLGEMLPETWTKTYLGWPGLGTQAAKPGVQGFADYVATVVAAFDNGPVDLLGQSMGGAIAMQVALDHPDRVRRIVLTATSGGLDVSSLGASNWRATYARDFPNVEMARFSGWPDLTADLPRISQPTLLLWSDSDPISPLAVGERLAAVLPVARLEVIPGGSHSFAHERPASIAALIQQHLA